MTYYILGFGITLSILYGVSKIGGQNMILGLITATVASTSAIELFTAGSVAAVALFTGTTKIKAKVKQ